GPNHRFVGGSEKPRVGLGDNVNAGRSLQNLREHRAHRISSGAADIIDLAALTAVEEKHQTAVKVSNIDDGPPRLEVTHADHICLGRAFEPHRAANEIG